MNHWTSREEDLGMEGASAVFPLDEKGRGAVLGCKSPVLSFGAPQNNKVFWRRNIFACQIYGVIS